jgi:hypothetical protein
MNWYVDLHVFPAQYICNPIRISMALIDGKGKLNVGRRLHMVE